MPVLPEMMPALAMEVTVFATIPNVPPDMVPAPELVTLAVLAKMAAPPAVMAPACNGASVDHAGGVADNAEPPT